MSTYIPAPNFAPSSNDPLNVAAEETGPIRKYYKQLMKDALTRLIVIERVYVQVMVQTRFVENVNLPACAGVLPTAECIELHYNPVCMAFSKIDIFDAVQILRHEFGHVILRHIWLRVPDREKANIAFDLELNQKPWVDVDESPFIEKHCCTYQTFKVPPSLSWVSYYELLKDKMQQQQQQGQGQGQGKSHDQWKKGQGQGQGQGQQQQPGQGQGNGQQQGQGQQPGSGQGQGQGKGAGQQGSGKGQPGGGSDDLYNRPDDPKRLPMSTHSLWGKSDGVAEKRWEQAVTQALAASAGQGTDAGEMAERVRAAWRSFPPIRQVIRRLVGKFLGRGSTIRYTHTRTNRRDISKAGTKKQYKPRIVIALDTSGSIGTMDLEQIASVIKDVQRTHALDVLQCDADVADVKVDCKVFDHIDIKGRGGTDFRPVFKWIKEKYNDEIDVLIYGTDLQGTFPDGDPKYKVIWLRTQSNCTAPFGKIIDLYPQPVKPRR